MSEPDRSTPGRRSALLLGAALLSTMTAACTEDEHPQEESTMATSMREPRAAVDEAVALLDDAQQALDDAFPGLSWTDAAPAGSSPQDGGCRWSSPTRRCAAYLAEDADDHERIAEALSTALEAHGLPAASTPTGGTGGWVTTTSTGDGMTLELRSKGYTELTVTVDVTGDCSGLEDGAASDAG